MKTTYKYIPLLQKGYPALFWIASAGIWIANIRSLTQALKIFAIGLQLPISDCVKMYQPGADAWDKSSRIQAQNRREKL